MRSVTGLTLFCRNAEDADPKRFMLGYITLLSIHLSDIHPLSSSQAFFNIRNLFPVSQIFQTFLIPPFHRF